MCAHLLPLCRVLQLQVNWQSKKCLDFSSESLPQATFLTRSFSAVTVTDIFLSHYPHPLPFLVNTRSRAQSAVTSFVDVRAQTSSFSNGTASPRWGRLSTRRVPTSARSRLRALLPCYKPWAFTISISWALAGCRHRVPQRKSFAK
jgi:hypothetical protein